MKYRTLSIYEHVRMNIFAKKMHFLKSNIISVIDIGAQSWQDIYFIFGFSKICFDIKRGKQKENGKALPANALCSKRLLVEKHNK